MSDFMQPEIYEGDMWQIVDGHYETSLVPDFVYASKAAIKREIKNVKEINKISGIFARLSAPGYLDCTDWDGPFDSEEEANDHLKDIYDLEDEEAEEDEE